MAAALALLPVGTANYDMVSHFIPWMHAVEAGGLASISGEFSNYSPPYIYLMYVASKLLPGLDPVVAIKLINLPFIAVLAVAIYQIVLLTSGSRKLAATAAAVLCVTPTPIVNAFAWGQTDCIYGAFLMLFVLQAIKRAPIGAAVMLGLSLSFKLQAAFLFPVVLYLILSRQMKGWHLAFIPLVYLVMMVPAAAAGRPWVEIFTVYVGQAEHFSELAIHAPNPWRIVGGLHLVDYRTGLLIGIALAGLAGLTIAFGSLRLERSPRTIVMVAALSAALMPYLLPKMHDRYFFMADILTLTLAFVVPRVWVTPPLFQLGSLLAYTGYFGLPGRASAYAIVPVTLAVGVLAWEYVRAQAAVRATVRSLTPIWNCPAQQAESSPASVPRM
jgi:Gpi18-like mannosyltransferase